MENREKILICLSGSPSNIRVIRAGADLAAAFGGDLNALFVETSDFRKRKDRESLNRNIAFAESCGAHVSTMYGEDAATQIAEYARISGTTKIVLGKSPSRKGIILSGDIMKRLADLAPDIDIFIVPDKEKPGGVLYSRFSVRESVRLSDILRMMMILALSTLLGAVFVKLGFSSANVILAYTLGVLAVAMLTEGRSCSLISSILSVMIFNFFFVEPYFSLRAGSEEAATFVVMFAAALLISSLTTQIKNQAVSSAQSAYRTEILLETSRKLQKEENKSAILTLTAAQLSRLLERDVFIYPAENNELGDPVCVFSRGREKTEMPGNDERETAESVLKNGRQAEKKVHEEILVALPLKGTGDMPQAIICIRTAEAAPIPKLEKSIMTAMLNECGIILENADNIRAKREAEEQIRFEELRSNLLNSISHDLRTPLTGIYGNAALLMNEKKLDSEQKRELYSQIYEDSGWLIRLVENLLSMTRISGGKDIVRMQPELISDIFEEALQHTDPESAKHIVETELPDEFILAMMDARLIVQVVINLVNNAVRYTQEGSKIVISAEAVGGRAVIRVKDNGPGIEESKKDRVFELFYTDDNSRGDRRRGMGLGLALCKSIVEAHGGKLELSGNEPSGAVFSFDLPLVEVNLDEQTENTCC